MYYDEPLVHLAKLAEGAKTNSRGATVTHSDLVNAEIVVDGRCVRCSNTLVFPSMLVTGAGVRVK